MTKPINYSLMGYTKSLTQVLESQYSDLPWPDRITHIGVLNSIKGGRGDIAAAAKVINLLSEKAPHLTFEWLLLSTNPDMHPPEAVYSFLLHPDRVEKLSYEYTPPLSKRPFDLILVGPVSMGYENYMLGTMGMNPLTHAPIVEFDEIAARSGSSVYTSQLARMERTEKLAMLLSSEFVPPGLDPEDHRSTLIMGPFPKYSGLLLDQKRLEASKALSHSHHHPAALTALQDTTLTKDLEMAFSGTYNPDTTSFNTGYAHRSVNWRRWILSVAAHEPEKDVVITLNRHGEFERYSFEDFSTTIFTPQMRERLVSLGYGKIVHISNEEKVDFTYHEGRTITIITREKYHPSDMMQMQLAAERILATGDNSAIEAWCSRCILYMYEDVGNQMYKQLFLQSQVDMAKEINPELGEYLALAGGDHRTQKGTSKEPWTDKEWARAREILSINPTAISAATFELCHRMTAPEQEFGPRLLGRTLRLLYQRSHPHLAAIEHAFLDSRGILSQIERIEATESDKEVPPAPDTSELRTQLEEAIFSPARAPATALELPTRAPATAETSP